MKSIMLTIHTVKNISTVQIKCGDFYTIENSNWTEEAKFPFKALIKGVYKACKYHLKMSYRRIKNRIITKLIEA